jgi:ferric-dicitrate binding protein FerR (iron transport regulator)
VDGSLRSGTATRMMLEPGVEVLADGTSRVVTPHGAELRLQAGTRVRWDGPETLSLADGSVYVATQGRASVEIRTPVGTVRDIGTRFMVALRDGELEVAMREGRTEITSDHGVFTASSDGRTGDVVEVDGGGIRARREPTSAARWAWIFEAHPGYRSDRVGELLDRIAADLGLGLAWVDPETEARAARQRIRGDLAGMGPEEALAVVLATSGLERLDGNGDALLIGFREDGRER